VRLWARNPAGSTYTVSLSASVYSNGQASRVDGCVATGDPWDTNSGIGAAAATATDVTSGVTPAVSMTTQNNDQLKWFSGSNWSGGAWTPPTSFTERLDTGDATLTVATLAQTTAGATGSLTATCASSDRRGALLGSLLSVALSGGTNLDVGNDALSVAGNAATLAVGAQVGNDALSVAANAATLKAAISTGNDALSVAANGATLKAAISTGNDAVSVGAFDASLVVGVQLAVGNDALSVAANSATLKAAISTGNDALSVAANAATLKAAISAGNDALSVTANAASMAVSTGAGAAALSVGAFNASLLSGTPLSVGAAAVSVGAFDVLLQLATDGLVGNAHGPLPLAVGSITVHTGTIAGAIT
jgi:hypothetical protein